MLALRRTFAKSALAEGLRGQRRDCGSIRAKASEEHLAFAEMFNSRTAAVFHGCGLTPELSRAAARPRRWPNHSWLPSRPRSGLGLSELLGWGQLLFGGSRLKAGHGRKKSNEPNRCAFARCKRGPHTNVEGKAALQIEARRLNHHGESKSALTLMLAWPNLTPELSRTDLRRCASED